MKGYEVGLDCIAAGAKGGYILADKHPYTEEGTNTTNSQRWQT